ncbi:MAG: hypothetical protein ACXABY_07790 [Candidatus Thorarchaeota archaeon]|jgi:hypothetical protein
MELDKVQWVIILVAAVLISSTTAYYIGKASAPVPDWPEQADPGAVEQAELLIEMISRLDILEADVNIADLKLIEKHLVETIERQETLSDLVDIHEVQLKDHHDKLTRLEALQAKTDETLKRLAALEAQQAEEAEQETETLEKKSVWGRLFRRNKQ